MLLGLELNAGLEAVMRSAHRLNYNSFPSRALKTQSLIESSICPKSRAALVVSFPGLLKQGFVLSLSRAVAS